MSRIKSSLISMAVAVTALMAIPMAAMAYEGTPDDFMQISQLLAKYSVAINTGDGDAYADNFIPNGVFQDPSICAIGHDAIANIPGHHPGGVPGKDLKAYHQEKLGPIIYQDKDHATAHSYVEVFTEVGQGKPGSPISTTGSYDDKYVRVNGKWKFAYRFVSRPNVKPPIPCAPQAANGFKYYEWQQ